MSEKPEPPKPAPVRVPTLGRPSKYDPSMCERVIELGAQGMSDTEIANELDIARATLHEWAKQHPDFSAALTRARQASLTWWETQQRNGYAQAVIGPMIYKLAVTNRFKDEYADRSKIEQTTRDGDRADLVRMSDEELDAERRRLEGARAARERAKAAAKGDG